MTRESIWLVTAKAIRVGKFALIKPVTTSTEGALGGDYQMNSGGAGHLGNPADVAFNFVRSHHHQVGQLVDHNHQIGQAFPFGPYLPDYTPPMLRAPAPANSL